MLIAVLLVLMVTSCLPDKKNKDPEPDLAGTYQVSQLIAGNQTYNLPSNGASAVVIVTRRGENQIDVRLTTTENGSSASDDFPTLNINKASGNNYDILSSTTRVGSINGTDFLLDFRGTNGQRNAITARK